MGCQQCCDGKCAGTLCPLVILDTVDGSEIPFPTTVWDGAKSLVNNGINYQPQLVSDTFNIFVF